MGSPGFEPGSHAISKLLIRVFPKHGSYQARLRALTIHNLYINGYKLLCMDRKIVLAVITIVVIAVIGFSAFWNNTEKITLKDGQRSGPFEVQKIHPDNVEGLRFVSYPISSPDGKPVTLRIGDTVSDGCIITLKLIEIDGDSAVFLKTERDPGYGVCPICLSADTLIDTPDGPVAVTELKEGMTIWTADGEGNRQLSSIIKAGKVKVPGDHKVVHLVLADGRELLASPGHPLSDGRLLGDIQSGDAIDGSRAVSTELVPYAGGYTYDILPSGETGLYWANGVLVRSTLAG